MSALRDMLKKTTISTKKIDNTLWASHNRWYSLCCQWHKSAAVGFCVTHHRGESHLQVQPHGPKALVSPAQSSASPSTRDAQIQLLAHWKGWHPNSLLYTSLCLLTCSSWAPCPLLRSHTLLCARLLAALFLLLQEDAEDQEYVPPDSLRPWCWWVQLREGQLFYSSAALCRLHPRNIPCSSVANDFPDSHISLFINVPLMEVFREL